MYSFMYNGVQITFGICSKCDRDEELSVHTVSIRTGPHAQFDVFFCG